MTTNPLPVLAQSLYQAILKDLLAVQSGQHLRRPQDYECTVTMFSQTWGSTALGFSGIGGQAMTSAYTVIVEGPNGDAAVYFGGRLAYHIIHPTNRFYQDIAAQGMQSVGRRQREYETELAQQDLDRKNNL